MSPNISRNSADRKFVYNDLLHVCSLRYSETLTRVFINVHAGVIETVLALFVQYCGVNLLTGVSLTSKAPLSLPEAPHGPRAGANSALGCVQFSVVRISKGPRVLATTPNVIFPNTDQGTSPKRLNSKWKKIQNINRGGNAVPTLKKDL